MTRADPRIEYATGARLRPWSRVWRYLLIVVLSLTGYVTMYGAMIVVAELGVARRVSVNLPDARTVALIAIIDAVICVVAFALMPLRRRAPGTIAVITAAMGSVSAGTASGPALLAAVSNATHRRWLPIAINGVVYVASLLFFYMIIPADIFGATPEWVMLVGSVVTFLAPAAFGLFIGARRALLVSLHARALEAERERELEVRAAQAGERTRIAREMHDVLAHRISLVAMHAGALTYREDLTREETHHTATLVQDNARRALVELRQVLGVLRAADGRVEPPQPTLAALPALVAEARAAGAAIDVEGSLGAHAGLSARDDDSASGAPTGSADPPDLASRTAFRIVQEALTNARKHAPGAPIRVRVDGRPGGLLAVEVTNGSADPAARPVVAEGSGMGLAGIAERVDLAGGTIDYGPNGKHGFAVRAWLSWEEETDD